MHGSMWFRTSHYFGYRWISVPLIYDPFHKILNEEVKNEVQHRKVHIARDASILLVHGYSQRTQTRSCFLNWSRLDLSNVHPVPEHLKPVLVGISTFELDLAFGVIVDYDLEYNFWKGGATPVVLNLESFKNRLQEIRIVLVLFGIYGHSRAHMS